jgi:2-polyprenyl-6-methoxyphenol hydroxylase-like FAD-dependent oxidoreductase
LLSCRIDDEDAEFGRPPIESLRRAFGPEPTGPVLENLLQQFEQADDYLFASVHQVVMPTWHTDRVVLLGDAAWCPTPYSGMGASSAISGADLLGTMLQRHPSRALREWDHLRLVQEQVPRPRRLTCRRRPSTPSLQETR